MTTTLLIPGNALTVKDTEPFLALTIKLRTSLPALAEKGGAANRKLCAEAVRLGINAAVPTQWLYSGFSGHPDDDFDLHIALPIRSSVVGIPGNDFAVHHVPAFRCAHYTYTGSWRDLGDVYEALFTQFYAAGYVYDGCIREVYQVVDRQNMSNCVTDIQIGIAGQFTR